MNALEILFREYNDEHLDTPEFKHAYDTVCNQDKMSIDEMNVVSDILYNGLWVETKSAYFAGFNTAVKLLMGSSAI